MPPYTGAARNLETTITKSCFDNPRPDHLRALVLDYLCHSSYTKAAQTFAKESSVHHLDADGDEIMPSEGDVGDYAAKILTEERMNKIHLRNRIRLKILSGRIDEATELLNQYFPTVLSEVPPPQQGDTSNSTHKVEYISSTTVEPAHLSLNLKIQAFIEGCRTKPLPYHPSPAPGDAEPPVPVSSSTPADDEQRAAQLLARAQKMHRSVSALTKPGDRKLFMEELENVSSLLVYPVPEESPVSRYLSQERRDKVADQINSAILHRCDLPAVSLLELAARYNSAIFASLQHLRIKVPSKSNRPPGISSTTLAAVMSSGSSGNDRVTSEYLRAFDQRGFLDSKV